MARVRRPWSQLKAEIYLLLRQQEATSRFSAELLLACWNENKDLREMELGDQEEGVFVRRFYTDIVVPPVNEPALYKFPPQISRLRRVLRIFEDGDEKPLDRFERIGEGVARNYSGSRDLYLPTFRLMDDSIVLEPPPDFTQTDGLAFEAEVPPDLFADNMSMLSDSWPIYAETLLVLDTAISALDTEENQAGNSQEIISGIWRRRERYEKRWELYTAARVKSRTFAAPNTWQVD